MLFTDVDADVLLHLHRPGGAHQEDGAEEHPLQLEPGVRRDVEEGSLRMMALTVATMTAAEDQPNGDFPADEAIDRVDDPAGLQGGPSTSLPCLDTMHRISQNRAVIMPLFMRWIGIGARRAAQERGRLIHWTKNRHGHPPRQQAGQPCATRPGRAPCCLPTSLP